MALCSSCLKSRPVNKCDQSVVIGYIEVATQVTVSIQDLATGGVRYEAVTAEAGEVTADLSTLSPNHTYRIIVLDGGCPVTVTFDNCSGTTTEGTCIDVYVNSPQSGSLPDQQLIIE